jgi:hypothetical protein
VTYPLAVTRPRTPPPPDPRALPLRIADAVELPRDCIVFDRDVASCVRSFNHKMKREALVPIDEEQHLILVWVSNAPSRAV